MKHIGIVTAVLLSLSVTAVVFAHDGHDEELVFFGVGGNQDEIETLNDEIEAKRAKVKELEATIEQYKSEIQKKRLESTSLSNQIAILDNRRVQIDLDIEATEAKLDALTLEIERMRLTIENKEKEISYQQALMAELIRTIHQQQETSALEIFAAYDNFSDFYNQLQSVRTVERDLSRSAIALREEKEELEARKEQRETIRLAFEETKTELENKQKDLDEQTTYRANLLAQTQASELTYQQLVDNLRSQYRQIENEIVGIEQEVRRRLEEQDKLDSVSGGDATQLSWPTQSRYITCEFHCLGYPFANVFKHSGMDIRAAQGTPIKAAASGYVARAKRCSVASCYSFIMIIHSGGISTVYGHLSALYVSEDQFVTRGDVIGLSGGTPGTAGAGPFVTGAHLHFEVRQDGVPVDPAPFML